MSWPVQVRLARARVRASSRSLLAQFFVLALSVALLIAGGLGATSFESSLQATAARLNAPHLWIWVSRQDAQVTYAGAPSVPGVVGRTPLYGQEGVRIAALGRILSAAARPFVPEPAVAHLELAAGSYPSTDQAAAVLERGAAAELGITSLPFDLDVAGSRATVRIQITGLVRDISQASYPLSKPALLYVTPRVWERLLMGADPESALFGVRVEGAELRQVQLALIDLLPSKRVLSSYSWRQPAQSISTLAIAFTGLLLLFGVLGLVAGLLLIWGLLAADLIRRMRSYGVMRAVGATPGLLARGLLIQNVALAIASLLAGSALGVALGSWISGQLVALAGLSPSLGALPIVIAAVTPIVLLAVAASSALATRALSRASCVVALAGGQSAGARGLVRRAGLLRLSPAPRLALGTLLGRPLYAAVTAFGLLVGVIAIVFAVVLGATAQDFTTNPERWGFAYQWWVSPRGVAPSALEAALRDDPAVRSIEPVYVGAARVDRDPQALQIRFLAAEQKLHTFVFLEGGAAAKDDEVIVGYGWAQALGLRAGDALTLQLEWSAPGETAVQRATVPVRVAGLYREFNNQGRAIVAREALLRSFVTDPLPAVYAVAGTGTAAALQTRLADRLGGAPIVTDIRSELRLPFLDLMQQALGALAIALVALAAAAMLALMAIVAEERRYVFGIVLALGARRGVLAAMIAWAAALLLAPVLVVGIPVGLWLVNATINALSRQLGGVVPTVPVDAVLVVVGASLILPLLAFALPLARAMDRSPMSVVRSDV